MFVEKTEEKVDDGQGGQRRVVKEVMISFRYHQLDAVRKIVMASRVERTGKASSCPAPVGRLLSPLAGVIPTIINFIPSDVREEDGQEESEKPPSDGLQNAK